MTVSDTQREQTDESSHSIILIELDHFVSAKLCVFYWFDFAVLCIVE